MLGNTGDELTNFWGLIGLGVAMAAIGLALQGPVWRKSFFGAAIIFVGCGLCWSLIRKMVPTLAPVLTSVTSSPSNWFVLLMVVVLSLAAHQYRKELLSHPKPEGPDGSEISEIRARLADTVTGMEAIWEKINEIASAPKQQPRPPINWDVWKHIEWYTPDELAAILTERDPIVGISHNDEYAVMRLMEQAESLKELKFVTRYSPDGTWRKLVSRDDAIGWAEKKNLPVEHIK